DVRLVELRTHQSRLGRDQRFPAAAARRRQEPVQLVQAKAAPLEKEGRARMLNRVARRVEELLRRVRHGKASQRRKKAKRHHRQEGHNNFSLITAAASEQKFRGRFFYCFFCRASASDANL